MNEIMKIARHPYKFRLMWTAVYLIIFAVIIYIAIAAANGIRTHTLPSGSVQLTVPYSKYVVGEKITFSIKNNYNSSISVVNNCPSEPLAVYRREGVTWVRQHAQASEESCPDEQRQVSVPTGGVVNGNFAAWHNLFSAPGKYRVVAFVEFYNSLPYQEFEVIAQPKTSSELQTIKTQTPGVVTPTVNYPATSPAIEKEEIDD